MTWIRYLLEANLYVCLFYLLYRLLFSRETHYTLNRAYLLLSCLASFVLPVLQLGFLKPAVPQAAITAINVPVSTAIYPSNQVQAAPLPHFTWQDGLIYLYMAGALIFTLLLLVKLVRLFILTRKQKNISHNTYKVVELSNTIAAYSFFRIVFIGSDISDRETIIRHELVHVHQKHSFDILLLEVIRIINWFNPAVYLLQNSLKAVHEYIADEKTAGIETDTLAYSIFLVNNAYGIGGPSVSHSFFNKNLLKQRITMLHQKRSGNLARLKYLLTLPVCAGLLCVSTLAISKTYGWVDLAPHHKSTIFFSPQLQKSNADTNKNRHKSSTYTYNNNNITGKGYAYKETGYLINGKTDFRVIITEKNGEQKSFFRDGSTQAQKKLLQEKYGYTFPSMEIFAKLPPPPPAPAAPAKLHSPRPARFPPPVIVPNDSLAPATPARPIGPPPTPARPDKFKKLPPPVVKPADTLSSVKPLGPVHPKPPKKILLNYYSDTALTVGRASEIRLNYNPVKAQGKVVIPLILVNGVKYSLTAALRPGEKLYITGSDSTAYYSAGDARAKKKWGADAANGVYDLHGKPSITIR